MQYKYHNRLNLYDPSQANWIHLLPTLKGKNVLKIGSDRTENINAILSFGCSSLSILGQKTDHSNNNNIHFHHSFDNLSPETFDIIIADEAHFYNDIKTTILYRWTRGCGSL